MDRSNTPCLYSPGKITDNWSDGVPLLQSIVDTKWFELGVLLLQPSYQKELTIIEAERGNNAKTCFEKMFRKWLSTEEKASWDKLLKALRIIHLDDAARYIEDFLLQSSTKDVTSTAINSIQPASDCGGIKRIKEIYEDFYPFFVSYLPFHDSKFLAQLVASGLLPGDLKCEVEAKETQAKAASHFLDRMIGPAIEYGSITPFKSLLSTMETFGMPLQSLAETVKCAIRKLEPTNVKEFSENTDKEWSGKIGINNLLNTVCYIQERWSHIGERLMMQPDKLDEISEDAKKQKIASGSINTFCCTQMLTCWHKEGEDVSVDAFLKAIGAPRVGLLSQIPSIKKALGLDYGDTSKNPSDIIVQPPRIHEKPFVHLKTGICLELSKHHVVTDALTYLRCCDIDEKVIENVNDFVDLVRSLEKHKYLNSTDVSWLESIAEYFKCKEALELIIKYNNEQLIANKTEWYGCKKCSDKSCFLVGKIAKNPEGVTVKDARDAKLAASQVAGIKETDIVLDHCKVGCVMFYWKITAKRNLNLHIPKIIEESVMEACRASGLTHVGIMNNGSLMMIKIEKLQAEKDKGQILRVTDNVKARYRRIRLVNPSNTWPPFHAKSFTNLALVHHKIAQLQAKKETTKIARLQATGDIQKVVEQASLIKLNNIHQIFTPISSHDQTQNPMSILIEGPPGVGKTTLAKEMCLQWANNQLLTSDKLVLLLMLRDPNVQAITTTKELVRYALSTDHDQVQCVLSYLQEKNGVGVTLIIDGFDELNSELRQTSFFRKVIDGDVLFNARIVVTSRPFASACLHQYVCKRIEVLGFEKYSKEQYMKDNLKENPELYTKLSIYFKEYPTIDALCYIPLNMAIIVYLCQLGSLPPTATKMYGSFIMYTICHHLKRAGKIPEDNVITKLEEFSSVVCEVLEEMEKIAFNGLMKEKIIFTVEELPVICKDDPTCFGLLQSTECYGAEEVDASTRSFNFLHLGIQEYFAAKYVTTLPEDEVHTLLKESFIVTDSRHNNLDSKNVRLSNMWILYCGITSGQCKTLRHYLTSYSKPQDCTVTSSAKRYVATTTSKQINIDSQLTSQEVSGSFQQRSNSDQQISNSGTISQDILKDLGKVLYLFQCFEEAQNDILCEVLSQLFDNGLINIRFHRLLPHQLMALGFFLSRSHRKWKELNLESCFIRDHGISTLHQYLCGDTENKPEIAKITLNSNSLTKASSCFIADIIHHLHPHTLNLCNNNIINVSDISAAVINTSIVKALDMSYNDLTAKEATAVSKMMIHLKELNINHNEFGDPGAILLSEGIAKTKTLNLLDISCNNIGPSGIKAIVNALSGNTSLQVLDISDNKFGDHEAELLSERIENSKALRVLNISNNNIGPLGTTAIAYALFKNTSLEELYMKHSRIGQVGAIAIANAFAKNKTLKKLSLWDNAMDNKSAMIIMKGLHCNNVITKLCLSLSLCNDFKVKRETTSINHARRKCNVQDLVVST